MSTLGNPGKFSYCIAEDEAANPWEPLHVELGFGPQDSTITLFGAAGIQEVSEHTARAGRLAPADNCRGARGGLGAGVYADGSMRC